MACTETSLIFFASSYCLSYSFSSLLIFSLTFLFSPLSSSFCFSAHLYIQDLKVLWKKWENNGWLQIVEFYNYVLGIWFLFGVRMYGQGYVINSWLWFFHSIHILSKQSWGVYRFTIWKLKYPSLWKLKKNMLDFYYLLLPQLIIKIVKFELALTMHCEDGISSISTLWECEVHMLRLNRLFYTYLTCL